MLTTVTPAARTRDLVTTTANSWGRNLEVLTKRLGPAAFAASATTAVDQWTDAMSWMLKTQRQYASAAAATVNIVSGLTARAAGPPVRNGVAAGGTMLERVEHSPRAEIESLHRVQVRQAEERRVAEVEAEREAARAADAERERVRLARNLARREARRVAKAEADRVATADAAEKAEHEAAAEAAREEAASKKAAGAERAAKRAKARQTARAAYVGRSKAQLVEELVGRGLPKSGNVVDLIERLVDADVA